MSAKLGQQIKAPTIVTKKLYKLGFVDRTVHKERAICSVKRLFDVNEDKGSRKALAVSPRCIRLYKEMQKVWAQCRNASCLHIFFKLAEGGRKLLPNHGMSKFTRKI